MCKQEIIPVEYIPPTLAMFLIQGSLSLVLWYFLEGSLSKGISVWGMSPSRGCLCPEVFCVGGLCLGVSVHGGPWTETTKTETPLDKYLWHWRGCLCPEVFCLGGVSIQGVLYPETPRQRPPRQIPLDRDTPWMKTSPQTEIPLDRDPLQEGT